MAAVSRNPQKDAALLLTDHGPIKYKKPFDNQIRMFPCGHFQFLNQGGQKNQLFILKQTKKRFFNISALWQAQKR
jgi:hypothetical protein